MYRNAYNLFNKDKYYEARLIYLKLHEKYPDDFEINYYLGACFLNSRYSKSEALKYLDQILKLGDDYIPEIVYKDIGDLKHYFYKFDEAIYYYKKYIRLVDDGDEFYNYAKRMIKTCKNGSILTKDTINLEITKLPNVINTTHSETTPIISSDENIIFYSKSLFFTDEELYSGSSQDTSSKIYVSYNKNGVWEESNEIDVGASNKITDVKIAGISPDGESIYVSALYNENRDIYVGRYYEGAPIDIEPLPYPINTDAWEGKITISPDGTQIWFSSDREGGIGGIDIYTSKLNIDGSWSEPLNMGTEINTKYNEDAPFIHPSGNILYFSSSGHNSIGGYDIFSILLNDNNAKFPKNIGFPINTTGDDMFFSLTANGNAGYFASNYGNEFGTSDIYKVELSKNIPLTLVKGYIKLGDKKQPGNIKLTVIDKKTGENLRYVYNPNPQTGKYLMIFPPSRSYDIIIEAEGFLPKIVNIHVPKQDVFYELYQNIHLKPVYSGNKKIGEQVDVENVFFSTNNDSIAGHDYTKLFSVINKLMEISDRQAENKKNYNGYEIKNNNNDFDNLFLQLDSAFEFGRNDILDKIHEKTLIPDKFEQVFFFSDEDNRKYLAYYYVNDDSILTSPALKAYFEIPREKRNNNELLYRETIKFDHDLQMYIAENDKDISITPVMIKNSSALQQKHIITYNIFFDINQDSPNSDYSSIYEEVARLFVNNENFGLIIIGHADSSGKIKDNKELSKRRAFGVFNELSNYGVSIDRVKIIAKGEDALQSNNGNEDMSYNRRVEIKVFEYVY